MISMVFAQYIKPQYTIITFGIFLSFITCNSEEFKKMLACDVRNVCTAYIIQKITR
jgi:hypothetical protein